MFKSALGSSWLSAFKYGIATSMITVPALFLLEAGLIKVGCLDGNPLSLEAMVLCNYRACLRFSCFIMRMETVCYIMQHLQLGEQILQSG